MAATTTLLQVRTEFLARGFDDIDDGSHVRVHRFINDAYAWIVKKALWPWRETTASGVAPLTIADLGQIGSVTDTANGNRKLHWADRRDLVTRYGDLTTTGSPWSYYIEGGNVVKTYPVGGTLSVRYWKDAATLAADVDILIVPDEWVQLVIDRACYRGSIDTQDWSAAGTLKAEVNEALADMMLDELSEQADEPDQISVYGGEGM